MESGRICTVSHRYALIQRIRVQYIALRLSAYSVMTIHAMLLARYTGPARRVLPDGAL